MVSGQKSTDLKTDMVYITYDVALFKALIKVKLQNGDYIGLKIDQ